MDKLWYQKSLRRFLFDMHIADWDDHFLSQFNPQEFMDCVAEAKVTAITVAANSHTGLCYWPTRVGMEHRCVKGKDLLGQMIECAHQKRLNVVIYYCTIYCDWYWENHPEARIVDGDGKSEKLLMNSTGKPRRFSVSCMNNPGYRQFVVDQLTEICQSYDFEGVWPDMTFWPTVCYCPACQQRYRKEVGTKLPRVINWTDPEWVRFQRWREECVLDFSHLITTTIKRIKPNASVAHQSHTFVGDWLFGPSARLAKESDFLSSDYAADKPTHSFYAKLFYDLSENKPFENLQTWAYPSIHEHVVPRSDQHMEIMAFSALMNNGGYGFVGFIDPLGTFNRDSLLRIRSIFKKLESYEPYAGGRFCQDVAIYFSFKSLFDLNENGKPAISARYNFEPGRGGSGPTAHRNSAVKVARGLLNLHIPYGVITHKDLNNLGDIPIVILSNVAMLEAEEIAAFKAYVEAGGCLYASKFTSLINEYGEKQANFMLSDLFGVSYQEELKDVLTYIAPTSEVSGLFTPFTRPYPVTLRDTQLMVKAHPGTKVLATVTLPYTDPMGTPYASILTDPPGIPTEYPAIVMNSYGKGKVIYTAGELELWDHDCQVSVFGNLLGLLREKPMAFETDAPKAVELTLFQQPEHNRLILHLINMQQDLPNIPVYNIKVRMWMGQKTVKKVMLLPEGISLDFQENVGYLDFIVPELKVYAMMGVNY